MMKKTVFGMLMLALLSSGAAWAEDASSLEISGDYRFRADYLKGSIHNYWQADLSGATMGSGVTGYNVKNDTLFLNRFGLNLKANPLEDVTVKARLVMYKVWGQETSTAVNGSYFADRAMGTNDGTISHVPSDNSLRVDYAYATISNIFGAPVWYSVGRRPSTGGIPDNLRQNQEKIGTAGIPGIMVNYAFDGMTLGYAPDINALPGAYMKLCYGKGFDSGYQTTSGVTLKDTDFLGLNVAVMDSENLHVELQWQKGWNIFDMPSDGVASFGTSSPTENLGNIQWVGGVVTGKVGGLNLFASAAQSKTDPNSNTLSSNGTPWGLLWTSTMAGGSGKDEKSGSAVYAGGRYDITATKTKIGLEYNQGSKNWIGMIPSDDDIWTSKLGTRGHVYEAYVIQELNRSPISKKGKAWVKLGYQYYKFEYTGSNSWLGESYKISDLTTTNPMKAQMLAAVEDAKDIYFTLDVQF